MTIRKCNPCNGTGGVVKQGDDPVVSKALRLKCRPTRTVECSYCDGTGNEAPPVIERVNWIVDDRMAA